MSWNFCRINAYFTTSDHLLSDCFSFLYQITGGAGFVGSHLVDALMTDGHEVTVVDNFFTGRKENVAHWIGHPNFELINHDVVTPIFIEGGFNEIKYDSIAINLSLCQVQ